jgi:hypothetical protein
MIVENLGTTNLILGIIAACAVLEAAIIIGMAIGGFLMYRRVMGIVTDIQEKHVGPLVARVDAILDDLKGVSAKVKEETERVDQAIRTTMDRVDDTADRVRSNVRAKTSRIVGVVRGIRAAIESFMQPDERPRPPADAYGR